MGQKALRLALALLFVPAHAFAACAWSTDLRHQPDGSVLYPVACHALVGQDLAELDQRRQQVDLLTKALADETAAYNFELQRASTLEKDDLNVEQELRLEKKETKLEEFLWFGLGVLAMSLAIKGAQEFK